MGFLNILGDVAKVALPIVGTAFGPLGTLAGAGLAKAIGGVQQGAQAKKLAAQNIRPVDQPESGYLQNEAEADQRASTGMGAQQYTNAENDIQKNQNFGLRADQLQSNGGLGGINSLVATGDSATNNLNARDDAARVANQTQAYAIRNALSQRRQQAFNWNDKQKFLENAAAVRALNASSSQNIWGGLNTATGAPTSQTINGVTTSSNGALGNGLTGAIGKGLTSLFGGGGGSGGFSAIAGTGE